MPVNYSDIASASGLPWCAGCGTHYKPQNQSDLACDACVKWNAEAPRKHLKAGFSQTHSQAWQTRWETYWGIGWAQERV